MKQYCKIAVEVTGLNAGYQDKQVLYDVTRSIDAGQMVAVLGPNGAGKSTLIRCLTGLCKPLTGQISLFGRDSARMSAPERARLVAVVPQELETPVSFTVEELVRIGRTATMSRWGTPGGTDTKVIERAMAYTDVIDMRNRPLTELSGGERQRAIIAMALAQGPELILMDEATSHLDMNHRIEVMQIVERLNREQGMTVVMISHDLNLAADFCSRLIIMNKGTIVADGRPADVFKEDLLRRVYGCEVVVQRNNSSGFVSVFPVPRYAAACSGKGIRVHVIAGGGVGEDVMRRLTLYEYDVTCGVLNRGDSDADIAFALELPVVIEKPFSSICKQGLDAATEMIGKADVVVVCAAPFGPANLANLDLALNAVKAGKRVLLAEGVENRDYSPGRAATEKATQMLAAGAITWRDITGLFDLLPRRKDLSSGTDSMKRL